MHKQRSNSKQNNNHSHKKIPKNHKKNHMHLQLSKQLQVGSKHINQLLKPSISPQNKKTISKNRTNNFDSQVNKQQSTLKVALELAQFHKNQFQRQKAKSQQLERKIQEINQQLCGLVEQNAKLIQKQKKHQDKYKKLKQKYRQLKKSPFCENKQIQNTPEFQSHPQSLNNSRINNQPFLLSYTTEKLQKLTKQIFMKNSIIIQLSEKIQECEHTTQNIYHLMDALQQKIQQLVKQNTVLRKISNMVSKQKSRKNSLSVIQHLCDSSQQIKISCSKVLKNNTQQQNTNLMNGIKNSNFSKLQTDYQINNKQNENNINLGFKKSVNGSHKLDNLSNSCIEYKDNIRENISQSIIKNHQQAIKHDHIYLAKNRMSGILTSAHDNANHHHTKYMQMGQHQNQQQFY